MHPWPFKSDRHDRHDSGDAGYTLIEVLIALTLASLLAGSMVMVVRDGIVNAGRFQGWFDTQTRLTMAVTAISYGYGQYPGAAGAVFVTTPASTQLCIVYNDASDRIVYYRDGDMLKRNRQNAHGDVFAGSDEVLLNHVDYLSFKIIGRSLELEIQVDQASPKKRPLSVVQRILMRNV